MEDATEKSSDDTNVTNVPPADDNQHHPTHTAQGRGNGCPASRSWGSRLVDTLGYVPPNCRYDPAKPFKFSMGLNVLFGTTPMPSFRIRQ